MTTGTAIMMGETFWVGLDWLKGEASVFVVPDEEIIVGIEVGDGVCVAVDEEVSGLEIGVGDGWKAFEGTVRGSRESARYILFLFWCENGLCGVMILSRDNE